MTDKKTRGFTLIELMIVILIAGLLMLVAAPFTSKWTASAKITEAQGVLNQAISRAKAAALRNPIGIARVDKAGAIQVAAAVCNTGGRVEVLVASGVNTPAGCAPIVGNEIWTHTLPSGLTLENIGVTPLSFTGLCFDNRGLVVSSCVSTGNLNIKVGTLDNHNVQFY